MRAAIAVVGGLLLMGSLLVAPSSAEQKRSAESPPKFDLEIPLKPFERFEGTIPLRTKTGGVRQLHVVVRNWIINNRQRIPRFPESGFMIVQLRGGEVITIIDGKRQERTMNEFWTVRAGATMAIETGKDKAVLQTMAVRSQK